MDTQETSKTEEEGAAVVPAAEETQDAEQQEPGIDVEEIDDFGAVLRELALEGSEPAAQSTVASDSA